MKCDVWSHVVTSIESLSFDFWFKDFLSNLPLKTIIYSVIITVIDQPSITRSQRSILNFKFSVLTFQWAACWALSKTCAKWKYFNSNLCWRCIDQRFAFKNSCISCLALIFKLKKPRTTVLYAKKSVTELQVAKNDKPYAIFFKRSIRTYGLVVKTSRRESGDMGSIPEECWNPLPSLGHFVSDWAPSEPVSALTRALFILLCSL